MAVAGASGELMRSSPGLIPRSRALRLTRAARVMDPSRCCAGRGGDARVTGASRGALAIVRFVAAAITSASKPVASITLAITVTTIAIASAPNPASVHV